MKRLITGFAIGALAVALFAPQVSFNYALAATGASVVVIDGKVNGKPVDQYILDEVANGRELSDVVAEMVQGGKDIPNAEITNVYISDLVVLLIDAGISPTTVSTMVTKAAPEYAESIVIAAISKASGIEDIVNITQAVMNEAPAKEKSIKDSAIMVISRFGWNLNQNIFDDMKPASPAS